MMRIPFRKLVNISAGRLVMVVCALISIYFCSSPSWAMDPRLVVGDAAEGLMKDFFKLEGWKTVEGQVGSHGIDGLFVKTGPGKNIDVLVAESKYGTSKLGENLICGKRQMSQAWSLCKLDELISSTKKSGGNAEIIRQYEKIKERIQKNDYRAELWHVTPENGKIRVSLQQVKSKGENVGLGKETLNKVIDLKNPQDSFQMKMANSYFANIDRSLKEKGVPDIDRDKIMRNITNNPSKINNILTKYRVKSPQTTPQTSSIHKPNVKPPKESPSTQKLVRGFGDKSTKVPFTPIKKRVIKGVFKNIKTGFALANVGSIIPGVGNIFGFLFGVAGGMAIDYLTDAFFASEPSMQSSLEEQAEVIKEIQEGFEQTKRSIEAVQERMAQEFSILGQDIQQKHDEQMAAINLNISISRDIKNLTEKIHTDLIIGIDYLSRQIIQVDSTLDSISIKIDKIFDRLDASLKANYDNGIY